MAFDVDAYIKDGRQDIRNSIRAHELGLKRKTYPTTAQSIDYLLKRQAENLARLEACIVLCNEYTAELKAFKAREFPDVDAIQPNPPHFDPNRRD